MKPKKDLLTPADLVKRWSGAVAEKTLKNWRNLGVGPAPTKIGRRIFYALSDVLAYEKSKRTAKRAATG